MASRQATYMRLWRQRKACDPAWRARVNARRRWRYQHDLVHRAARLAQNKRWKQAIPHDAFPLPYTGAPLLEQARQIAGPAWYGNKLYQPLREDAAGEALLALLEGRDPHQAVRRFLTIERAYQAKIVPLFAWRW